MPYAFYTASECEEWLNDRGRLLPDKIEGIHTETVKYPTEDYHILFLANWIAKQITCQEPALLWITEWGIWPSSENWHLYYKLRQSHEDQRLLEEAPGHYFLKHKMEELTSFIQVAMQNGWGGYVLTGLDQVHCFFSHDEYVDFYAGVDEDLSEVRQTWGKTSDTP